MVTYYSVAFFILLSLYISSGNCSQIQTVNGTIHVTIGTTSGCIFVPILMGQVDETFARYGKYIDIEFVPWGRTVRGANGSLICQFGDPDCWSNRVQRCALTLLKGNLEAQVRYMVCEFSEPFPAFRQRSLACTQRVGLNILAIDFCLSTSFGDTLEDPFQERSREGMAIINRIPFVYFNKNVDLQIYNQLWQDGLQKLICEALKADPSTTVTSC